MIALHDRVPQENPARSHLVPRARTRPADPPDGGRAEVARRDIDALARAVITRAGLRAIDTAAPRSSSASSASSAPTPRPHDGRVARARAPRARRPGRAAAPRRLGGLAPVRVRHGTCGAAARRARAPRARAAAATARTGRRSASSRPPPARTVVLGDAAGVRGRPPAPRASRRSPTTCDAARAAAHVGGRRASNRARALGPDGAGAARVEREERAAGLGAPRVELAARRDAEARRARSSRRPRRRARARGARRARARAPRPRAGSSQRSGRPRQPRVAPGEGVVVAPKLAREVDDAAHAARASPRGRLGARCASCAPRGGRADGADALAVATAAAARAGRSASRRVPRAQRRRRGARHSARATRRSPRAGRPVPTARARTGHRPSLALDARIPRACDPSCGACSSARPRRRPGSLFPLPEMFRKGRIVLTNPYVAGDALQGTQRAHAGGQAEAHDALQHGVQGRRGRGRRVAQHDGAIPRPAQPVRGLLARQRSELLRRPRGRAEGAAEQRLLALCASDDGLGGGEGHVRDLALAARGAVPAEARGGHRDVLETGEGDGGVPLVGARLDFAEAGGGRRRPARPPRQIVAAAKEAPDFFAVHGCVSPGGRGRRRGARERGRGRRRGVSNGHQAQPAAELDKPTCGALLRRGAGRQLHRDGRRGRQSEADVGVSSPALPATAGRVARPAALRHRDRAAAPTSGMRG